MSQKIPPQALDLEKALLGGLMLEKNGLEKVVEILSPPVFYRNAHRIIYEAILDLFQKNEPIDFHTVVNRLKMSGRLEDAGEEAYLMELLEGVVSSENLEAHAKILKEKFVLRELIDSSTRIIQDCYEETEEVDALLDKAESKIFNISQDRVKQGVIRIRELLPKTFEEISRYGKTGGGISGITSGFTELDERLSGFQKSDLIIIAARPSMGKTALALSIAANMSLRHNIPTGIFSLEMSAQQLLLRLLCAEARINMHSLRSGKLPNRDYPKLSLAAGPLNEAPLFIDDSPSMNILEIRAKSRRLKAQYDVEVIMVDYLQLLRGLRTESREQEISQISRSLKALAKELNVPVIALSQLNRKVEDRTNARPQLADLRESGAIEQDADVVIFIYREEIYKPDTAEPGKVEIIIGKQRNGPVGKIEMTFVKDYARFENYSARQPEPSVVYP